jgi:hypothetical protein
MLRRLLGFLPRRCSVATAPPPLLRRRFSAAPKIHEGRNQDERIPYPAKHLSWPPSPPHPSPAPRRASSSAGAIGAGIQGRPGISADARGRHWRRCIVVVVASGGGSDSGERARGGADSVRGRVEGQHPDFRTPFSSVEDAVTRCVNLDPLALSLPLSSRRGSCV